MAELPAVLPASASATAPISTVAMKRRIAGEQETVEEGGGEPGGEPGDAEADADVVGGGDPLGVVAGAHVGGLVSEGCDRSGEPWGLAAAPALILSPPGAPRRSATASWRAESGSERAGFLDLKL